jgi:hypothetical protein
MALQPTRRALLSSATALTVTATAGCSVLPGGNDPDAGPDSYGVLAENDTDTEHTLTVAVTERASGDTVFEQSATVPADGTHEWDEVLTGDGLYRVTATVDDPAFAASGQRNARTVVVGTENSVDATNVTVILTDHSEGFTAFVQLEASE